MKYYICYANEDRLDALRLKQELISMKAETCLVDRGDADPLIYRDEADRAIDPINQIISGITSCTDLIVLHSEFTNRSLLSQLEITYAKNLKLKISMVKLGNGRISDALTFALGNCHIIKTSNMNKAARTIIRAEDTEK